MATIGLIIIGLVLLFIGAEGLVRSSASFGLKMGITPLVVGLTIVGYGTSTPELIVSVQATLAHQGDVAIGNIVGSNIFNIGFILGLSALINPLNIQATLNRFDIPVMIASAILLFLFSLQGILQRWHGIVFLVLVVFYTFWITQLAKKQKGSELEKEEQQEIKPLTSSITFDLILVILSFATLIFGARWFLEGSIELARLYGISEAIIGLTLIAGGTSLPELATSMVAAYRGHSDIAVGNIIGSNIYNILGILGISSLILPITTVDIGQRDYLVMISFSLYLAYFCRTRNILSRFHGFILVAIYCIYVFYLYSSSS